MAINLFGNVSRRILSILLVIAGIVSAWFIFFIDLLVGSLWFAGIGVLIFVFCIWLARKIYPKKSEIDSKEVKNIKEYVIVAIIIVLIFIAITAFFLYQEYKLIRSQSISEEIGNGEYSSFEDGLKKNSKISGYMDQSLYEGMKKKNFDLEMPKSLNLCKSIYKESFRVANCIAFLAEIKVDSSLCLEVDALYRDKCLTSAYDGLIVKIEAKDYGSAEEILSQCESLGNITQKAVCLGSLGNQEGKTEYCSVFEEGSDASGICYSLVSEVIKKGILDSKTSKEESFELCGRIKDNLKKEECMILLINQKKYATVEEGLSYCRSAAYKYDGVWTLTFNYNRNCLNELSKSEGSARICDGIEDQQLRGACLGDIYARYMSDVKKGVISPSEALENCRLLPNDPIREECITYIVEQGNYDSLSEGLSLCKEVAYPEYVLQFYGYSLKCIVGLSKSEKSVDICKIYTKEVEGAGYCEDWYNKPIEYPYMSQ